MTNKNFILKDRVKKLKLEYENLENKMQEKFYYYKTLCNKIAKLEDAIGFRMTFKFYKENI